MCMAVHILVTSETIHSADHFVENEDDTARLHVGAGRAQCEDAEMCQRDATCEDQFLVTVEHLFFNEEERSVENRY